MRERLAAVIYEVPRDLPFSAIAPLRDLLPREAPTLQPDQIQPLEVGVVAPDQAVGDDVLGHGRETADEGETADPAVLVLGMVAFLAAMTQTPITSFVIVMEMTANHQMLLPLMATAVVAHGVSRSVAPVPLYHALSHAWLRRAEGRLHHAGPAQKPPALPAGTTDAKAGSADPGALDQRL